MFALGLLSWMYSRPTERTISLPASGSSPRKPEIVAANIAAFRAGWNFGETTEDFAVRYEVKPAPHAAGHLPQHHRQPGAGARPGRRRRSARSCRCSSAPTRSPRPRDILHELSKHKRFGVTTIQAEDEIAGDRRGARRVLRRRARRDHHQRPRHRAQGRDDLAGGRAGAAAGRSSTSSAAGPSTGLPTKTEQADLLHGAVRPPRRGAGAGDRARSRPSDCFDAAIEAARIALTYRTPVILLSDGYIANGSEPWLLPDVAELPDLRVEFATEPNGPRRASSCPTCATRRRWPGRGRSPARRAWSTASAAWRRPTRPATSPTTRPTTTSWSAPGRRRSTASPGHPPLEVEDPTATPGCWCSAGARRTGRSARPAGGSAQGGLPVAQAHLRHLNPLPPNLGEVLQPYDKVVIPEMNLGPAGAC